MQAGRLERLMHGLGAAPEDEILFSIEQPLFLEELAQEIDELCRRRLQNNLKYNLVQVELQPAPYGTQLLIRLV